MDTSKVTTGDKVTATAAVLLVIDLLFLPWHQVFSFSLTAVESPGGWWGTLAVLLTLIVLVVLFLRRFANIEMHWLPRPVGEANLALNGLVLAVLVLKLLLDPNLLGFGSYLALILATAMVVGAALGRDETDEAPPVGSGRSTPTPF